MASNEDIKVLLVDDRPENLLAYQTILDELKVELVTAQSGDEALKQILAHDFAVVLLDVNMPGIDGFETANLIRSRKRSAHTPIIFVTAFADEMRTSQGYASGAVDYLLTPIVPEVLQAKVKVFVELFRMTQQVRQQSEERLALARERIERAAAEEKSRLLRFLADVTGVVGQTLDADATARDAVCLSVPEFADCAIILRQNATTGEWGILRADSNGEDVAVTEAASLETIGGALARAAATAMDKGEIAFEPSGASNGGEAAAIAFPLGSRSSAAGVWAISREASGRRFNAAEVTIARSVASRVSMALQNAELYKALERADQQKNEFLSMLAHELRNPLAPIRNGVDLLRLQGHGSSESVGLVTDIIDRQTTHLVKLVDELLDVSRITRGKIRLEFESVNVADVVAAAVETCTPTIEAGEHSLTVCVPDEPLAVYGDRVRLVQVVSNLLTNAAKYTPPTGKIALTVGVEDQEIVLSVRDNGIGVPRHMLDRIFELFTQVERSIDRSQGGLGIGLTLVKRLVELHGGRIGVASEGPGHGTEFTVRLPAAVPEDAPFAPETPARTIDAPRECRILVVDDNADVATTAARLLRARRHRVLSANDGRTALELAQSFQPQVVVLDLGLPGLDGFEVARRLRASPDTQDALIIAVSGYGQDEHRRQTREAGFDVHFVKPVSIETILQAIAERQAEFARPSDGSRLTEGARS